MGQPAAGGVASFSMLSMLQDAPPERKPPVACGGFARLACVLAGGLCGFLSLLAPFLILFSKKDRPTPAIREMAIVSIAWIALLVLSNFRHVRYVIPVLPPLCFLLALVFYRFLKQPPPVRTRAMAAMIILLIAGFVHGQIRINVWRRDVGAV